MLVDGIAKNKMSYGQRVLQLKLGSTRKQPGQTVSKILEPGFAVLVDFCFSPLSELSLCSFFVPLHLFYKLEPLDSHFGRQALADFF
jgi:hypothetical protein